MLIFQVGFGEEAYNIKWAITIIQTMKTLLRVKHLDIAAVFLWIQKSGVHYQNRNRQLVDKSKTLTLRLQEFLRV